MNTNEDDVTKKVSRIVAESLLVPESERFDFICNCCGSNVELLRAVQESLGNVQDEFTELKWDQLTDKEFDLLDKCADNFEQEIKAEGTVLLEDWLVKVDRDLRPYLFHELAQIQINYADPGQSWYLQEFPEYALLIQNIYANAAAEESPSEAQKIQGAIVDGPLNSGRYRILQSIGKGGMGQVFLAEQTEPVKRRVAIKVIKTDAPSKEVLARFEAERQALAMMDHPNIAKVLDAGVMGNGQPFFAMEFVKGVPITAFCEQNQVSPNEKIQLLIQTCRAIQHAHQKGIIHRDIKPTNILVSSSNGQPTVKVIDFGLAKALLDSTSLTDRTLFTHHDQVVGTLEFMSPEQAELSISDIDTRTDVYSLGVLFYELLTGRTPLGKERLKSLPFDELLRTIREDEARKPSSILSESSHSLKGSADQKSHQSKRLGQICRGDLDWIALKALEKDRSRRYESPSAMADDLERFLANEPIVARPPSLTYRLRKSIRKHRFVYALTLTVLVAGFSIGLILWNNAQARHAAEVRRQIINQIELSNAETDFARLLFAIERVNQKEDRQELKSILRTRINQRIDALSEPDLVLERWGELNEMLGLIDNDSERANKVRQIDNVLAIEFEDLVDDSSWFSEFSRIHKIVERHSNEQFRSRAQDELERRFIQDRITSVPRQKIHRPNSSREFANRRFVESHQQLFPQSTLQTNFDNYMEAWWTAQESLNKAKELEQAMSRIERKELLKRLSEIIDFQADAQMSKLLQQGIDSNQERHNLKQKLERLEKILVEPKRVSAILQDPRFVSPLVPINLTPHLVKFCERDESANGSWKATNQSQIEIEDVDLGREFEFSTTILNAGTGFFEVRFYVRNIEGARQYPWKIYFKLSNDRKYIRTHIRHQGEVVRSFLSPLSDRFELGIKINPNRVQIKVGRKIVNLHQLFEDSPRSRFSFRFLGTTVFSDCQLAVSSAYQPVQSESIRAGDLAFLDGRFRTAHDIYQRVLSKSVGSDIPIVEFKSLLSKHRDRPSNQTISSLVTAAKSREFPMSVYACNELIADSLNNDRLELDPFVPSWLFSCIPEDFDDLRAAYSPNLTKQALQYVIRNQKDHRLMKRSEFRKVKLEELIGLTERIRNYLPDTVLREFEFYYFESFLFMDQKEDAQKYIQLLSSKTDSFMHGHGNYFSNVAWLAIQQKNTPEIENCIHQIQLPGRIRDSYDALLWKARLFLASQKSTAVADAKQILENIVANAPKEMPYAEAALLYGLLLERENNKSGAEKVWQEAYAFCGKDESLSRNLVFILLGCLTNQLDADGFQRCVKLNLRKDLIVGNLISVVPQSLKEEIAQGLIKLYGRKAGRDLAFRLASRQIGIVDFHFAPHVYGLTAVLLSGAFPDANEKQEQLIMALAQDGIDAWRYSKLNDLSLPNLISVWAFTVRAHKQNRLAEVVESVPEELRDRLRYLLAHRLRQQGATDLYEILLKQTATTSDPQLKTLLEQELMALRN